MIDFHVKSTGYASHSTLFYFLFLYFYYIINIYYLFHYFLFTIIFLILLGMDSKCFFDLDWPTNASSPLSASAELLVHVLFLLGLLCVRLVCFFFMCCLLFWFGCHCRCKWLTGETCLQHGLQCVNGDVKHCSLMIAFGTVNKCNNLELSRHVPDIWYVWFGLV